MKTKLSPSQMSALREERATAFGGMQGIIFAAEGAGASNLTRAQADDYDRYEADLNRISALLDEDWPKRMGEVSKDPSMVKRFQAYERELKKVERTDPELVVPWGAPQRDELTTTLSRSQSVRERVASRNYSGVPDEAFEELGFGGWARGLVRGARTELERRVMGEGTLGAGGAAVPTIYLAEIVDRARARAVCIAAGARTLPMESDTVKIPKLTGDPTVAWRAENTVIPESDALMELQTLDAETAAGRVRASYELIQDAVGLEELLFSTFTEQLALKLDYAGLRGTGAAPEPGPGVRSATGVTTQTLDANGRALTFDDIITAVTTVRNANIEPKSMIWTPRTAGALAKVKDADGNYIDPPDTFKDLQKYQTTSIPTNLAAGTGTNLSEVYVGNFEDLVFGIRMEAAILILQERSMDALQYEFVFLLRADVAVVRGESFVVITNVSN